MRLIATKRFTYATRHLVAGDEFDASLRHARVLVAAGRARNPNHRPLVDLPAPEPVVIANIAATLAPTHGPGIAELRDEAAGLGVEFNGRWGAARLRAAIDAARETPAS